MPDTVSAHVLRGWHERLGWPDPRPGFERNQSVVAAPNHWSNTIIADMRRANVHRAFDETKIRDHAENYALLCSRMKTLVTREAFAVSCGVTPPSGKRITPKGAAARLEDTLWWRRQLRKNWTRASENAMRETGAIRKGRAPYASDEAVKHRSGRQRRTREWLKSRVMVNGEGEQLPLIELHEKSLANPALRRGEFMCRMRGFEEIATELEHVALFFTLTAPSAFHAQLSKGGANPLHDRQTVRDAQQWLCKMWARVRAKLRRMSILFYGFRVAEPHHDGTPHWHLVLFSKQDVAGLLSAVLRQFWLSEYSAEPGAAEHRCKVERIEPGKGSATGYIAKYISKNIDGAGSIGAELSDETGKPVSAGVARVAAWASCHGIRQFQQIGGPPVGLWRELRRVREPVDAEHIERARMAADAGQWREFITALGGMERAKTRVKSVREKYRRKCTVTPQTAGDCPLVWLEKTEARRADRSGRDVVAFTRYGEPAGNRVCGVVSLGMLGRWNSVDTRKHRWRIQKKDCSAAVFSPVRNPAGNSEVRCNLSSESSRASRISSDLGPVAITVRGDDWRADGLTDEYSSPYCWVADIPYRETRAGPHDRTH